MSCPFYFCRFACHCIFRRMRIIFQRIPSSNNESFALCFTERLLLHFISQNSCHETFSQNACRVQRRAVAELRSIDLWLRVASIILLCCVKRRSLGLFVHLVSFFWELLARNCVQLPPKPVSCSFVFWNECYCPSIGGILVNSLFSANASNIENFNKLCNVLKT